MHVLLAGEVVYRVKQGKVSKEEYDEARRKKKREDRYEKEAPEWAAGLKQREATRQQQSKLAQVEW